MTTILLLANAGIVQVLILIAAVIALVYTAVGIARNALATVGIGVIILCVVLIIFAAAGLGGFF